MIVYDPVCDWYIGYETYFIEGDQFVRKRYMHWHYGKTNIPKTGKKLQ